MVADYRSISRYLRVCYSARVTERWRARAQRMFARCSRVYSIIYHIGGLRNQKVRSLLDVPSKIPA